MKKRFPSFLAGAATALTLTALATSALAASGQVQFNFAGVALDGEMKITAGSDITAPNGQQVPGSILYVDEAGGKTNYLPIRTISELLGVEVGYDSASRTVLLGEQTVPSAAAAAETGTYWHKEGDEDGITYASEDTGTDYTGAPGYALTNLPEGWGLESGPARELASLVRRLAALAAEKDMTQLEVNPLALSEGGGFVALDAKMNFDDSALKRHPDIAALRDREEGDPLERAAAEKGLTYVRLGGSIGTLVNGAGLAMATMDAIKQAGAEPANFLDAGGGASEETVAAGFSIMLSDPHVRGILINIFGGILRCDIVAHGIVNAARKLDIAVPLVVRLEGTNVAEGRRILRESGLRFHTASSMSEAARLIVGLAAESPQEAGV